MSRYQIVAIGGGGGAPLMLHTVAPLADQLTALIAVTDTGRSTGLARQIGHIPAPGDLRSAIATFASDPVVARLLQHRFDGQGIPQLEGMAFGNLLLAAFAREFGDFAAAVAWTSQLAGCQAHILPITTASVQLCAELADGQIVQTELAVRGLNKPAIKRLFLNQVAPATPAALEAIASADLVLIGPGSLFTTVLAALLSDGLVPALRQSRAKIIQIVNSTTQPGQTDGYRAVDHVARLVELLGPGVLDAAVINRSVVEPGSLASYEAEGLFLLQPDDQELAAISALGVVPLVDALIEPVGQRRVLWNKQDTIRYDQARLRQLLFAYLQGGSPTTNNPDQP